MIEREEPQSQAGSWEGGSRKHPCPVVGIGASAGGLEAFQAFFTAMPPDSGMAFVLVQHLSPRHDTLMPELLAQHTAMPVRLVEDEMVVEPNRIYVLPPNATLTIDDCVLFSSPSGRVRGRRAPIDNFFRSLAEDQGDNAVGIVLSGTGTDGVLGLKAIQQQGGLTLVQAPATALYDGMPRAALLTEAVDHALPVEEMPATLEEHIRKMREERGGATPPDLTVEIGDHLGKICAILRREAGHDFRLYKRSTLVRRIRRRMHELRAESVASYVERLAEDAGEADQLFRDLLIGVTHFFRDPEAFDSLAARVIPRLFEGKDADGQVRVWVPGCATGEEAYSLAMLLTEHLEKVDGGPRIQVFATDIDDQALEVARQAWYPESVAGQVTPERFARFFVQQGNMVQVAKEVREMCLFSVHNLISDPPFSRLDLISCRNLLIYLESELQKKLLPLCHYALRPGGFLFLGPSESVAGRPELFRTLDKKHRIFQSRDTLVRPPVSFPLAERGRLYSSQRPADARRRPAAQEKSVARAFETILLEDYAPACVVVKEWGEIVHFSPRTGRYLEPPAGEPRLNVLDMARQGLRLDLRTALHRAVNTHAAAVQEDVVFELDGQAQRVNLIVRPMAEVADEADLYMVVFQEIPSVRDSRQLEADGAAGIKDPLLRQLEAELKATKDHLQATLEELESSNEELVSSNEELLSMNEELQSANEELQTSKEELQSVNEELETVNTELKKKLEELDQANSDLQNISRSTQIATVFVDRDLRIKKFTLAATEVFRLIESDIGRPITDISPRFIGGDLVPDIEDVLRLLVPRERQVRLADGEAWYILRILPYRTMDNVIDGVVLAFVDISDLRKVQEQRSQLARIVESSPDAIIGKTLDGVISSWNSGAERVYGYSAPEAIGRPVSLVVPPERLEETAVFDERAKRGELVEPFETLRLHKDGSRIDVLLSLSALHDASGRIVGLSSIARDISERKKAEAALLAQTAQLVEADRRKDEFLAILGHELRNPLAPIRNCLHILRQELATPLQAEKARTTIERQVAHLTRLVDDLLDVSRISRGKILLRRERLDVVEVVRAAVEDQRPGLEGSRLGLELDLPPAPLWVSGDPTRLAQVVGNVLHNAAKFTDPEGRISVAVRQEPGRNQVVLAVKDTGIGMEAELLARIFEPFSQAGQDHGRGGLGLGLALVKALVELHEGAVQARSDGLGRGSEILIQLPLDRRISERPKPEEQVPLRSRPRRCLIIEDNVDSAQSLGLLLELAGHQVALAHDARSGLDKARQILPEVVLCDIGLPGDLDGHGVARTLRSDPTLAAIHLIALTGYGQEEDRLRALAAGFDAHLTKPAELSALQRFLAELP